MTVGPVILGVIPLTVENQMAKLLFKLEYTVRDLWLAPECTSTFAFGGPHDTKVELRQPSNREQLAGHKQINAFCTASSKIEPNPKVAAFFEKIVKNEILPEGKRIQVEYTTPKGTRVHIPPFTDLPEYFQSFAKGTSDELKSLALRTIEVFRWRANELGPHNPISSRGFTWSTDREFWHPMPAEHSVRAESKSATEPSVTIKTDVHQIVDSDGNAPLHHDLFREAWQQRFHNPRSSIIVGMAAAEIAVKRCVSNLVPNAEWLATNLPTPPLARMLSEYLPQLPAKCDFDGEVLAPPKPVLDDLKKGVTIRNQLTHAGASNPSGESVQSILQSVHDLLWIVDYYSGYEWALEFLRPETLEAIRAE